MMPRTERRRLPSLPAEVPQFVIDKAEDLLKGVRPLGHPRAARQDIVERIDVATAQSTAKALDAYNLKLGNALAELDAS